MPVYEVLENNIPKFRSMGIELVGTGLAKIDGKKQRLFIQSYWSTSNSLRAFLVDPDDKGKGYKVKVGKDKLEGKLPVLKGGRPSKKNPSLHHHSTVTDFARLRGWSTSVPFSNAVR